MKYIIRSETDKVQAIALKKGPRQMVSISGRLYRCDDCLFHKDENTSDAFVFYDIDSSQPRMLKATLVDPDHTLKLIAYAKLSNNVKNVWANLGHIGDGMMKLLVPVIIVAALIIGFLG